MLDVANQLKTMSRYPQAAAAYEKYLKAYPTDPEVQQVKLLLGIIYAKYLNQHESAQKYLRDCLSRLTNPDQVAQAQHWLDAATSALGHRASPA
jgi:outer membrane protein assembly factor BamD (BamD/ComL family)